VQHIEAQRQQFDRQCPWFQAMMRWCKERRAPHSGSIDQWCALSVVLQGNQVIIGREGSQCCKQLARIGRNAAYTIGIEACIQTSTH
jgi:hypothetical protein